MKKIFALLTTIIVCINVSGQFKQIAQGPIFKEPEKGYSKIIQMKSGKVAFLDY